MNLRFETDGQSVRTHFQARAEHAGFRDTVHGGLIATLLDEIMVWACAVRTKRFSFCGELKVRFLHPLRPGETATASAELVTNRRERLFEARAELRNAAGLVVATASGKYLPVKAAEAANMVSDFVGDATSVLGSEAG